MDNKTVIMKKMLERGYTKVLETRNSDNNVESITFIYEPTEVDRNKRFPIPSYNVTVWLEDFEFQFMFAVATSINKLISPKCGSFMNDDHFYRLAMKF